MTLSTPETKDDPLSIVRQYWHIVRKWKWTALTFAFIIFAGVTVFAFLRTPVYTSTGTVWIENEPNILPFQEVLQYEAASFLMSHSKLLQSRALAAETIDKLRLYENPHFVQKLAKKSKGAGPSDPIFREKLIEEFLKRISVEQVQQTRLIQVRFTDRDPKFAGDTLNVLFDQYMDMIVRQKYVATEQASQFLNAQIEKVRTEIQDNERRLNQYGADKNILPLTATETPTIVRLNDISKSLTEATIDRIKKEANYNEIKSAASGTMDFPEISNNPLIQRLRENYATLSREYAKRLATDKPEYPTMQNLRSEMDAAQELLKTEVQNIVNVSYSDFQTALKKEQSLQLAFGTEKNDAFKANNNSIIYNSLKIEIDNKKNILESLLKRESETDVTARMKNLKPTNVWIVDRADYPIRPRSPRKSVLMLMGLLIGLGGGLALTILIEYMTGYVKTSKDVTKTTGLPTLGSVPSFEAEEHSNGPRSEFTRLMGILQGEDGARKIDSPGFRGWLNTKLKKTNDTPKPMEETNRRVIELIASREPQSIQAESYRSIRTTLLVSSPPGKIKSILFTSPLAREGKSATISNLGITLAQAGKRVVIVDSDLRKPKQNKIFDISRGTGLTHFLSSNIDRVEVVKPTPFPNLFIVGSGPIPASPIELLTSERMDDLVAFLKRSFDYVLFDAPPILVVSDAIAMGPMIDGVILVARGGQTPLQAMKQAKQKLDAHRLKCLGVILNSVDLVEQDGYYARQYYKYYHA